MYYKDYVFSDTEFNLVKLHKKVIMEAFKRHSPNETIDFISFQLGISSKTLHRTCKTFGIYHLIEDNKSQRSEIKRQRRNTIENIMKGYDKKQAILVNAMQ